MGNLGFGGDVRGDALVLRNLDEGRSLGEALKI